MATRIREAVRLLYNGDSRRAHQFRYGLLAFDILTITFLIISSFVHTPHTEILDGIIGILLSVDFAARLWIAARPWHYLRSVYGITAMIDSIIAKSGPKAIGNQRYHDRACP